MASRNRKGFALPMAIMIIAILTAAIAAGFAATASETVVNNAQRAQERAYQLAEAGLQQFTVRRSEAGFCTGCAADPSSASVDSEYTRVSLPGGYADVVAYRVRPELTSGQPAIYFIRSKGVDTSARLSGAGSTTYAERTVGVYAKWNTTTIRVLSTLTSLNGLSELGSGIVDSANTCAGSTAPNPAADVTTIPGSAINIGAGISVDTLPIDSVNAAQAIDWNAIVNANQLAADITIPPGAWPISYPVNYWPIIRVKTSAAGILPSGTGQGIIIADSNFTIPRGRNWNGIILVGGRLLSSGSSGTANIRGALVTGLNRLLPGAGTPPTGVLTDNDSMGTGQRWRYNSCNVSDAGLRLHMYFVMSNTWMDNVAIW